eukprot:TRINITY_DN28160_c0_g1_i1.p1 TRINITY_DN28160_c0_g1~~TRINITY_DN28160_c0_g1_i1.p1  ORF type:complete len:795 (+),score=134.59 TRINITY_DN28160_c0_g1_i1:101-2485(+)
MAATRNWMQDVDKVCSPMLHGMLDELTKRWPDLHHEAMVLLWLCERMELRPPAWWPSVVRHPVKTVASFRKGVCSSMPRREEAKAPPQIRPRPTNALPRPGAAEQRASSPAPMLPPSQMTAATGRNGQRPDMHAELAQPIHWSSSVDCRLASGSPDVRCADGMRTPSYCGNSTEYAPTPSADFRSPAVTPLPVERGFMLCDRGSPGGGEPHRSGRRACSLGASGRANEDDWRPAARGCGSSATGVAGTIGDGVVVPKRPSTAAPACQRPNTSGRQVSSASRRPSFVQWAANQPPAEGSDDEDEEPVNLRLVRCGDLLAEVPLDERRIRENWAKKKSVDKDFEDSIAAYQEDQRRALLNQVPLLSERSIGADELRALATTVKQRSVGAGETLCQAGETLREFFVVKSGALDVFRHTGGREEKLATLKRGASFGEVALLRRQKCGVTVKVAASTENGADASVLCISREDLDACLGTKGFKQLVEFAHVGQLASLPGFSALDFCAALVIAQQFSRKAWLPGQVVGREGDVLRSLLIVEAGEARMETETGGPIRERLHDTNTSGQNGAILGWSHHVGLLSLLLDAPLRATVTAGHSGGVSVLELSQKAFKRGLADAEEYLKADAVAMGLETAHSKASGLEEQMRWSMRVHLLRGLRPLALARPDTIATVLAESTVMSVASGGLVMRDGHRSKCLYVLERGTVTSWTPLGERQEHTYPGTTFGCFGVAQYGRLSCAGGPDARMASSRVPGSVAEPTLEHPAPVDRLEVLTDDSLPTVMLRVPMGVLEAAVADDSTRSPL